MSSEPGSFDEQDEGRAGTGPPRARWLTSGCVGLMLLASAYQACFAHPANSAFGQPGQSPNYSSGNNTGIIVGGVLGGAAIAAAAGAFGTNGGSAATSGAFPIGTACEENERYPVLPADQTDLTDIRLVPEDSRLHAGMCRCFHLEVRSARDHKWYSVTNRPETHIEASAANSLLMRQEGSGNTFCVPLNASGVDNGNVVVDLLGTFTPPGHAPMTATARVRIFGRS
jgi:hypothetical protein